jgi:hypothetical protein
MAEGLKAGPAVKACRSSSPGLIAKAQDRAAAEEPEAVAGAWSRRPEIDVAIIIDVRRYAGPKNGWRELL